MKRFLVLGILITIGGISIVAAQQPAADAPKVIEVEKVKDNLFVLRGEGGGGNTAVFVMANGVAVVDAKNPGWGAPILACPVGEPFPHAVAQPAEESCRLKPPSAGCQTRAEVPPQARPARGSSIPGASEGLADPGTRDS